MSPKEQNGTQSRRTETGGSPHPANNRPDEWDSEPEKMQPHPGMWGFSSQAC